MLLVTASITLSFYFWYFFGTKHTYKINNRKFDLIRKKNLIRWKNKKKYSYSFHIDWKIDFKEKKPEIGNGLTGIFKSRIKLIETKLNLFVQLHFKNDKNYAIILTKQQKRKFFLYKRYPLKRNRNHFLCFLVWTKDDKRDIEEEKRRRKGLNSFHVYLQKMNLRLPEIESLCINFTLSSR